VGESFAVEAPAAKGLQLLYLGSIGNDEHLFRLVVSAGENQDNLLRQIFGLTQRESEVLLRVAKGFTLPEIGVQLGLSRHTIADYVKQIYRKLNVSSRAEAALEAQRLGLFRR